MIGDVVVVVVLVVLLAGVGAFGAVAWRGTLHLVGLEAPELALWRSRFREWRGAEARPDLTPVSADSAVVDERVERILALLGEKPGNDSA
jgi:hypothetical protein